MTLHKRCATHRWGRLTRSEKFNHPDRCTSRYSYMRGIVGFSERCLRRDGHSGRVLHRHDEHYWQEH